MTWFARIHGFAIPLCFAIVVFGAYVRLSDAGLGCPDWPGCYGHLTVAGAKAHAAEDAQSFAHRPLEESKAIREMIHRYLVSMLGICVFALLALAALRRSDGVSIAFPVGLLLLIVMQALLGKWTVTHQLTPVIVTGHLLGGLATLSLVYWAWLYWRVPVTLPTPPTALRLWALLGLALLIAQIALGGWTSSNYAAAACPDFPTCHGQWLPPTDYASAFSLRHREGVNYEYGVLDNMARVTIHWTHRLGAAVVATLLGGLGLTLLGRGRRRQAAAGLGACLLAALALQLTIGISLIELHFPLWLGDAHTAGAAVLLLTMITVNHWLWGGRPERP